jgi:nitric oxide reductase NorD protein
MNSTRPASPEATRRRLLDHLAVADPEAARRLGGHLKDSDPSAFSHLLSRVVDEVIEALALEVSFGRQLADGMGRLLAGSTPAELDAYRRLIAAAAARGPTLAVLFARHLVPVLQSGDARLVDRFEKTTRIMLRKGTYTLKAPLETLSALIEDRDLACARAFLDLLAVTYALKTSYNRTVYLTHTLPRAVDGFAPSRRQWQIRGLTRVIGMDERLADDYLQGMAAGLHLLSAAAMNTFLNQAEKRYRQDPDLGARFLSLQSRRAKEICRDLQVAVPLSAVRADLERYLHARTGLTVPVRCFSALGDSAGQGHTPAPLVRCDGQSIYLPDEMDLLERQADNTALFKLLVRLEAGAIEFGTYDLDADKVFDDVPVAPVPEDGSPVADESELGRFLRRFDRPLLALDLFTLFEHGRIAGRLRRHYPGLHRRIGEAFSDSRLLERTGQRLGGTLSALYRRLVMDDRRPEDSPWDPAGNAMIRRLNQLTASGSETVETSARLAVEFYPQLDRWSASDAMPAYGPLTLPFGRRFEAHLFGPFHSAYDILAKDIRNRLAEHGVHVYRSDIRHRLAEQNGQLSAADIRSFIVTSPAGTATRADASLSGLDLEALAVRSGLGQPESGADPANAFRYREWDWNLADYLPDRVRVMERDIQVSDPGFYRRTLDDFSGLVKRIRYAFELLRPEEMTILRQWREGDAFDYRALLDYALDKKAGLIPSDRLFIKRMKKARDVAVLLLVDLSRSTANAVDGRGPQVLDVEKQAIILLCEALNVVGDRYAIAGFSGTGPLGVDYYRIKDLEAPFDDAVRGRIGAMAPQRSTRMGAAIRHAIARFSPVEAKVKLILILSDGFPNDLAYKGAYAVEDTRRAVMEARTAAIHVKAITVNISDNGQLDRLYGAAHHTLISHVRDLPDRLVRIYGALTRH